MKKLLLGLALIAVTLLSSCSKEDAIVVNSVKLDKSTLSLQIENTHQFVVSYLPSDAPKPTCSWESSNNNIVSIDNQGIATAISVGTATITGIANDNLRSTCEVTVTPIGAASIALNKNLMELVVGDEETLTYTIAPENTTNKDVEWSSSDNTIATVDATGKVTAIGGGSAQITVKINTDISDICEVIVSIIPITGITIEPKNKTIDINEEFKFTYSLAPENATPVGLIWKSSDNTIASINNGICRGVKEGSVKITVESPDGKFKSSADLVVKDMFPYNAIGVPYISKYGYECTVTEIIISSNESKNTCSIKYTIKNITTDKELSEVTFKCKTQSGEYKSQYGFFGNLFPNESISRSYTFSSVLSDPFVRLELSPVFLDVIDSSKPELIWKAK